METYLEVLCRSNRHEAPWYSNGLFQFQVNPTLSVLHIPVTIVLVQVQVFQTNFCLQCTSHTAWKIQLKICELPGNITAVCDSIFNNLLHALPEYKDLHPLHSMCHLLLFLGTGGFPEPQPYTNETQKQYTMPFIQYKI